MAEIILGFEGSRQDVNDLGYQMFDQMLREGETKQVPGDVSIRLEPMPLRKGVGRALVEVAIFAGENIALPLFVAWLYDKWKKAGEKPISIHIENHIYQFDTSLMTKAIQDALTKQVGKGKGD
jgi:hypothetical protein